MFSCGRLLKCAKDWVGQLKPKLTCGIFSTPQACKSRSAWKQVDSSLPLFKSDCSQVLMVKFPDKHSDELFLTRKSLKIMTSCVKNVPSETVKHSWGLLCLAGLYENQDRSAVPIGHKLFCKKKKKKKKICLNWHDCPRNVGNSAKLPDKDGLVALSIEKNATSFSLPNQCR